MYRGTTDTLLCSSHYYGLTSDFHVHHKDPLFSLCVLSFNFSLSSFHPTFFTSKFPLINVILSTFPLINCSYRVSWTTCYQNLLVGFFDVVFDFFAFLLNADFRITSEAFLRVFSLFIHIYLSLCFSYFRLSVYRRRSLRLYST